MNPNLAEQISIIPISSSSDRSVKFQKPSDNTDVDDINDEADKYSEEFFNDLAEIEGIWNHCLQAEYVY